MLKTVKLIFICLLAMLVLAAFVKREDIAETLTKKLGTYQMENPAPLLYLHLDKSIYNTNEDIWFKAYMLTPDVDSSKTLYVRLTDQNKRIIISSQFPMTDVRANGDMLIPDTLRDGDYYLYAYTGRMMNFGAKNIFVQRITVKRNSSKKMFAEAAVVDTTRLRRGQNVQVHVLVKDGINLLKNIKGQYFLLADGIPTKGGKISTNEFGETFINFTYPQLANDKSLVVKISFKNNDDFADLILNLRHEGNALQVKLFPEGGGFLNGIPTKTTVQVTDMNNNPVTANVKIKTGDQALANIQTGKNGLAAFTFIPTTNKTYTIETDDNGVISKLPFTYPIETKGYNLKLVKQKDGFKAIIRNVRCDENALLLLRSFNEVLWTSPAKVPYGDSLVINIPAGSFSKQVLSLDLFDANSTLAAERLFLNKKTDDFKVDIKTDYQVYGTRKKVTVSIHTTDAAGQPVAANLSAAAVENDRTDEIKYKNIVNASYFRGLAGKPGNLLAGLNDADVEALMIAQNWGRAQWDEVLKYKPKGNLTVLKNTDGVVGSITPLTKKHVKLEELVVMGKSGFFITSINEHNLFFISPDKLIRDRSEKEYLIMNDNLANKYKINIINYEGRFDDMVAATNATLIPETFNSLARYLEIKLPAFKGAIMMKEVKINSGVEANTPVIYKSSDCNDMVCMYNILNCKNHPGCCNPPVDGAVYSLNGRPVIYKNCSSWVDPTHIQLKCISIPKKFYLADYEKEPSYEPELHSTVYWNANLNTDKNGDATFSFYTSDITGNFLVTAQGVDMTNIKPMYGTGTFKVK